MKQKRYADDYETVVTTDEKGRERRTAVYRGDYYAFALDDASVRNFRLNSLLLAAIAVALHTAGGCVGNAGMYRFFVALPYVGAFFPLVYLVSGALRLPKTAERMTRDVLGHSYGRAKTASCSALVLAGMTVLGELACLLFFLEEGALLRECVFLLCEALTAAACYAFIYMQSRIQVRELGKGGK